MGAASAYGNIRYRQRFPDAAAAAGAADAGSGEEDKEEEEEGEERARILRQAKRKHRRSVEKRRWIRRLRLNRTIFLGSEEKGEEAPGEDAGV